jgi:hypothetical protein
MKAFAQQVDGEKAFHVKVVAAPWTERERYRQHCFAEKKNPDNIHNCKGLVRICHLESYPHDWHIGKAH